MKIRSSLWLVAIFSLISLSVTGCGIKPNNLEAPTPEKTKNFPATYPQKAD